VKLNWPDRALLKEKVINNKHFYDPALFPNLDLLRNNMNVILEELQLARLTRIVRPEDQNGASISGIWCEDKGMEDFYNKTKSEEGWLHWWSVDNDKPNKDWTIFGLVHKGNFMDENCKRCPKTKALLEQLQGIRVAGFSRIQPKSGIDTHKGFTGKRYGSLAWHLGLVIPPNDTAWLTCGEHSHIWRKPGEVIVFDDTWAHSAWNASDQERIILYIDFQIPKDNVILEDGEDESDSSDLDEELVKWMALALMGSKKDKTEKEQEHEQEQEEQEQEEEKESSKKENTKADKEHD